MFYTSKPVPSQAASGEIRQMTDATTATLLIDIYHCGILLDNLPSSITAPPLQVRNRNHSFTLNLKGTRVPQLTTEIILHI
ncbi:hypothetical protein HRI_005121800 [Hibiscus trionum]|uniref:Uncharacterized protein n=1 Tax=Hibiscus trionum TaxID=183268 RepID=A0A9W7JFG8_HIBTR|nr:hypothetical protein HRI_005121800 [Hibiscus trionum]